MLQAASPQAAPLRSVTVLALCLAQPLRRSSLRPYHARRAPCRSSSPPLLATAAAPRRRRRSSPPQAILASDPGRNRRRRDRRRDSLSPRSSPPLLATATASHRRRRSSPPPPLPRPASQFSLSLSLSLSICKFSGTATKLAYPFGLAPVRYDILIILIQITDIFQRNQGKAGQGPHPHRWRRRTVTHLSFQTRCSVQSIPNG